MLSISVIIPIYNVEHYVRRCLESVMAQDTAEAEIECIIVDDCGTDHSMGIVRDTIASYKGPVRFRLIQHEENRGLSAARNTGVKHSKADYIIFIDSDDYLMPDSIRYFVDNLKMHPSADMVMGNVRNEKGGNLLMNHIQEPCLLCNPDYFYRSILQLRIYLYAWNKLIRRSLLIENQVFFIEGILYEDQSWSYSLAAHLSSILLLPKVTYVYEYNQSSIVNTAFSSGKADKALRSFTVSVNYLLDNPPAPERFKKNMAVDYMLFMVHILMTGVDLLSRFHISPPIAKDFTETRLRLMRRSLRYGRVLIAFFCLLLFPPLSSLQRLAIFRHHYNDLRSIVNIVAHLTDFLHSKNRI